METDIDSDKHRYDVMILTASTASTASTVEISVATAACELAGETTVFAEVGLPTLAVDFV